ncbi:MAG TPA: hypothetical protein VJG65_00330 [Patescibacteria group bacterium]|nr:hypothetical protein [Patescibacteria group bacterium]
MKKNRLQEFKNEIEKSDLQIKKGLMKIYSNQDGSLPDITQMEQKKKNRAKILFFSVLGLLIIVSAAWFGFIFFGLGQSTEAKSIKLELIGPQSVASGDEIVYVLNYQNLEKVVLDNIEIIFRYPDGFSFGNSDPVPTNNFNTSWQVGNLAPGAGGKIEIRGKLIGEVGSLKTISVTASYQPQNFSSPFKESQSFTSQITSSILNLEVEGPAQILPEKKVNYKITYENSSEQDLKNVKILIDYPANFVFQESEPKPYSEPNEARNFNNQWLIEEILAKEKGEILINGGYLAKEDQSAAEFKVKIGFWDEATQTFSLQQEKTVVTEIIGSGLNLELIINGSNQNQPVGFGQTLTYTIIYKNSGQKDLDELNISVVLDSDILDWSSLDDKNDGVISGNEISWGKDQISEMDLVRPLTEGTINFSINTKSANQINLNQDALQIKSKITAKIDKIGEFEVKDLEISSNEIINNLNTDVELEVEGRYFDDDNIAVGSGPLPPVVGEKTTFRIYWSIANSLNELSEVKVTTQLPLGVDWADKFLVKTGEISYSSKNREITWSIKRALANKGFDDINAWFDVAVVPTKNQVKKLLILTDQTALVATDQSTNAQITKTGKAITSNLEDDPIGGGKGVVVDISE